MANRQGPPPHHERKRVGGIVIFAGRVYYNSGLCNFCKNNHRITKSINFNAPKEGEEGMIRPKILAVNVMIDDVGPFDLYELDNFDFTDNLKLKAAKGIYLFTVRCKNGEGNHTHTILYVGKTTDYSTRFNGHHKAKELSAENPNCLAIYSCDEDIMDKVEISFIKKWSPKYNEKHND